MSRIINYIKANGFKSFFLRASEKLKDKANISYSKWRRLKSLSEEDIKAQREKKFQYSPLFSIVVPLYKTDKEYLLKLVDSVEKQTYEKWELCFSDGSGSESELNELLKELKNKNEKIKYVKSEDQLRISDNTNAALKISEGDFIVFMDHDDVIEPDALFECVEAVNIDKDIDFIYTDEDKVNSKGNKYFDPHFKPDFSINLLRSMNYICHMVVVKKTLLDEVGGLRSEFDGAQDYDFVFRCVERAVKIHHIPKVLYHWRTHMDSTSFNPSSKTYAFEAGRKAIEEHYKRHNIKANVENGETFGLYKTIFRLEDKPLVSVIIPNKDHVKDLKKCVESIEMKSTYRNLEYIIVENNSNQPETFSYYEELKQKDNVKVISYQGGFNFSKIINFGVQNAEGFYLLILNNDTELINESSIEQMIACCEIEDVGIVGARLLYPDNTVQHAGVIIGLGGIAGHAFVGLNSNYRGYFSRAICMQDYSAVTAACLMVSKELFQEVNGFNEELEVAFNDIDFCLKIRKKGKLVVYNPNSEFYHYESKSRGKEDTKEKVIRFKSEVEKFRTLWSEVIESGDPYYNRNLTLSKYDFSLRRK